MSVTVTTQAELDQALADKQPVIYIQSPAGVPLTVRETGSAHVVAWGYAHVAAWGSAHVVAQDSVHVEAWGSAHVEAHCSAHVVARDSAQVEARGSAHVVARGSAHVVARGSAYVVARGSAHVEAQDFAHVEAQDSVHVEAWGSAHVEARDSAHVVAWDSVHVEAGKCVAVHLFSQSVELDGGVVIDMTRVDATRLDDWLALTGVQRDGDDLIVYKAVDDGLLSGKGFAYPLGETVTDSAWRDDHNCGGGLHFSPTPSQARGYFSGATRFLECRVPADRVRCIDSSKLKSPVATVVREVDLWREPLGDKR